MRIWVEVQALPRVTTTPTWLLGARFAGSVGAGPPFRSGLSWIACWPSLSRVCDNQLMTWRFWTGPTGLIWANAGEDRTGFNEALNDSISSLSPRGQPAALSTYWIDRALERIRLPETGDEIVVSGGNSTHVVRQGGRVRAEAIYGTFADDWMELDEFERGLEQWRERVEQAIRSGERLAKDQENYQRNPWPA